jgi:hypothetical protein
MDVCGQLRAGVALSPGRGVETQSGHGGKEKNFCLCPGYKPGLYYVAGYITAVIVPALLNYSKTARRNAQIVSTFRVRISSLCLFQS